MKRIVTMQDISCVGKCSLTVALPTISAMGVEAAVLPTAVLSTHTMFKNFTFHDLTDEIPLILNHWKQENFDFDAVYTGYLGSITQLDIAASIFETYPNSIKIVDPCMADNGQLYPGFNKEFVKEMRNLCAKADIICPNLTEASFLLDIPYVEAYDRQYIEDVLHKLADLGCDHPILTGISFEQGKLGAIAFNKKENSYEEYYTDEEPKHFHGTGDLWASAFCGALVNNIDFTQALKIACDFVKDSINCTLADPNHNEYGVNFEEAIPNLVISLKSSK